MVSRKKTEGDQPETPLQNEGATQNSADSSNSGSQKNDGVVTETEAKAELSPVAAAAAAVKKRNEAKTPKAVTDKPVSAPPQSVQAQETAADKEPAPIPLEMHAIIFPEAWCPGCGLRLESRAPTGQGGKNYYKHPFQGPATAQSGKPCEFQGKTFDSPTILLREVVKK